MRRKKQLTASLKINIFLVFLSEINHQFDYNDGWSFVREKILFVVVEQDYVQNILPTK